MDLSGFSLNITYKDFTHEMLRAFIKYSAKCSQNITYDCYNAKLGLGTHFWLKSVNSPRYIETLGTRAARRCECVDTHSCYNASLACNCDSGARTWLRDDGNFIRPTDIAVTQVYALPPPDLGPESLGRLTLGPLECTDPGKYCCCIAW
ncbi:axo [Cordylochernes scorpioides]|uniref:Axo n=1 Tax=Cordylochernes scorpioides TaxID=51811 RepID=A0ABY6LQH7_9ARAC|nr:axo [Cordylochernes scorpioides]